MMDIKRIYAIGGLGVDEQVFQYLSLEIPIYPVKWIPPMVNESMTDYAHRLSLQIDGTEPFALMGLSFGGMMAMELLSYVSPEKVILISSASSEQELPGYFKWGRWLPLKFIIRRPPYWLMKIVFGTNNPLLKQILAETDMKFTKWAVHQIVSWKLNKKGTNIFRIHGDKDLVIPRKGKVDFVIKNGGHFMVVDQAQEVSGKLNQLIY